MASNVMRIDADDFISPGLECTKPPEKTETGQVVSISIDDCLACSGCITSAEEIMLQQHNTDEIVQFLEKRNSEMTDDRNSVVICGISGQSLASLCVEAGTSVAEYMAEVRRLLAANGVDYIFDYSWATAVALESTYETFKDRPENAKNSPMMCSACPGWVVYAEKEHGKLVTHLLSKVKSPQQILGRHLKQHFSENFSQVYHFSVMPCFDKKLEAARKSNRINEGEAADPEVDVVISTAEFKTLLEQFSAKGQPKTIDSSNSNHSSNFDQIPGFQNFSQITSPLPDSRLGQFFGADSYLNYIYRRLEADHNLPHVPEIKFSPYRKKFKDFQTCELKVSDSKTYKFAAVYGFKSIQNIIIQLKSKKCHFDYIEVMACPSGCVNGGGQIRYQGVTRDEQLEKLKQVEAAFLESGLLTWPKPEASLLTNFSKVEDFTTYFSDPNKNEEEKEITGQNLILLGSNF